MHGQEQGVLGANPGDGVEGDRQCCGEGRCRVWVGHVLVCVLRGDVSCGVVVDDVICQLQVGESLVDMTMDVGLVTVVAQPLASMLHFFRLG